MLYSRTLFSSPLSLSKALARSFLVLLVLINASQVYAAAPKVIVSIKPLQLIASAITEGVTTPELLLLPGTSPHDYTLRPSDIRKLASADLVFWIGEDLEGFLISPLNRYVDKNQSIALMDLPNIKISPFLSAEHEKEDVEHVLADIDHDNREHADHGAHNDHNSHDSKDDHHEQKNGHHDHNHGTHDPHIWLEPDNAKVIALAMMQALSGIDKAHSNTYQANYLAFVKAVNAADALNRVELKDKHDKGFFVFHDAWGYFTRHYGLKVVDVVTLNPEQQPGARHMLDLRDELKEAGNTCVFKEPQFNPAYLNALIDKLPIKVAQIDPLGSDIKPSPDAYPEFLRTLAKTINTCLTK